MSFQYYYFQITINNNNKRLFSDSSLCWLVENERGTKHLMIDLLWMTIHLGVKDRALLSRVGAESQKHCAQGSSRTLKQGGQWTGTNCVLTIKKTDNAIPPRHKRTVEKCVNVCLSVCLWELFTVSFSWGQNFCVSKYFATPEAVGSSASVYEKDEFRSDRPIKAQRAACLLFP